jgi:hypothetical protein
MFMVSRSLGRDGIDRQQLMSALPSKTSHSIPDFDSGLSILACEDRQLYPVKQSNGHLASPAAFLEPSIRTYQRLLALRVALDV